MKIHPAKNIAVYVYGFNEQPDWNLISKKLIAFQEKSEHPAKITSIETSGGEHCIVIHTEDIPDELVNNAYENIDDWDEEIEAKPLNWAEAFDYLKEIRMLYNQIGSAGLISLQLTINPLFVRHSNGERTKELFDAIMELK